MNCTRRDWPGMRCRQADGHEGPCRYSRTTTAQYRRNLAEDCRRPVPVVVPESNRAKCDRCGRHVRYQHPTGWRHSATLA